MEEMTPVRSEKILRNGGLLYDRRHSSSCGAGHTARHWSLWITRCSGTVIDSELDCGTVGLVSRVLNLAHVISRHQPPDLEHSSPVVDNGERQYSYCEMVGAEIRLHKELLGGTAMEIRLKGMGPNIWKLIRDISLRERIIKFCSPLSRLTWL
jgi:hypothetical protein